MPELTGFVQEISGHQGHLFETLDGREAFPVDLSTMDNPPPLDQILSVVISVENDSAVIESWEVAAESGPPALNDYRLGVFVQVRPGASADEMQRQQRTAESHARELEATWRQELPPWVQVEARGVAVESNEPTHPHRFMRGTIHAALDEGLWDDWEPTDFITFGGPVYNGGGGHNSGRYSVVYAGRGINVGRHENGHGLGAPHNKEIERDGSIDEYADRPGSDWMGTARTRFNVLSRRSAKLLWDNRTLEAEGALTAILAPLESLPDAIPDGCYQAIELPGGIWLSQRTHFGILSAPKSDAVHVHHLRRTPNGGTEHLTVGIATQRTPIEYEGWTIRPVEYRDGLLKIAAVREGERVVDSAGFPAQPLPVLFGTVEAHHAGVWEDPRYPKQGLCLYYTPERELNGVQVPEGMHGCWFTQTQERTGKGHPRWMTVQGAIVDGVAELTIREPVDGHLFDVGKARLTFDDATIGEMQFALHGQRGQLLLSKVMDAGEGSCWYADENHDHEGVLLFVDDHATQAWLFRPGEWRYLDISPELSGTSYAVSRSSFLNTREGELSDAEQVSIDLNGRGLELHESVIEGESIDTLYRGQLV